MTVTIGNIRNGDKGERVDRGTPLGNPYRMRGEKDRDRVCDDFARDFAAVTGFVAIGGGNHHGYPMVVELHRLRDILRRDGKLTLLCWCAPKRCHAETIKRWLEDKP